MADADNTSPPPSLHGDEALALARQGKDAWNKWAAENEGREVRFEGIDFSIPENRDLSFQGFIFPGDLTFHNATFEDANFANASFLGEAEFVGVSINDRTWFTCANFKKNVSFDAATFVGGARFGEVVFSGTVSFESASFSSIASFTEATFLVTPVFVDTLFGGAAEFNSSTFFQDALFDGAEFLGEACFLGVVFKTDAIFFATTFKEDALFSGTTFGGPIQLNHSSFRYAPDFRRCSFSTHVTLHGVQVEYRNPADPDDVDNYRRLKEIAAAAKDHDREQLFLAYELKAKRGHEVRGLAAVPNWLYEKTSDYGRSIGLPTAYLGIVWFVCAVVYANAGTAPPGAGGLLYSAALLLPFLPGGKGRLDAIEKGLFGEGADAVPQAVTALGMLEGVLGLVFLFLIGLALRNRFRL